MAHVLIYAGIDEAGYGPLLGPLCVACTVFAVRDLDSASAGGECDLWKRLNKAVCRKRTDKRRRIAIDDSKVLKATADGPHHPLKFLERGVLSFLSCRPEPCPAADCNEPASNACADDPAQQREAQLQRTCSAVFSHLGVRADGCDWYGSTTRLPVGQSEDELRIAAARLRKALEEQAISCEMMRCEAIDAGAFNEQVDRMGNKANVNLCAAMRLIDAVWQRWPAPEHHPTIVVDHHGGRIRYLQTLMQSYPDAQVQVLAEEEAISSYHLTRRMNRTDSTLSLTFMVEAESAHLPVALASMTAKYVRELFMLRMNRHFTGLMPELKPTAGYTEDGRRYLQQIEPLIADRGIDRRALVRCV